MSRTTGQVNLPITWMVGVPANRARDFSDNPPQGVIVQGNGVFHFTPRHDNVVHEATLVPGIVHPIQLKSVPAANEVQFFACYNTIKET